MRYAEARHRLTPRVNLIGVAPVRELRVLFDKVVYPWRALGNLPLCGLKWHATTLSMLWYA